MGMVAALDYDAPGTECLDVLSAPDCVALLADIENGTLATAVGFRVEMGSFIPPGSSVHFGIERKRS